MSQAVRLAVGANGLNCYQHHTKIYFNLSLNRPPRHASLLKNVGIDNDALKIAGTFEKIYQCAMRTALRTYDSNELIDIIVPDENMAIFLAGALKCTNVNKLDGLDLPSKAVALSSNERKSRSKFNAITDKIFSSVDKIEALDGGGFVVNKIQNKEQSYSYKSNSYLFCKLKTDEVGVTFHGHYTNNNEDQFSADIYGIKDLLSLLNQASKTVIKTKDETILINSAMYGGDAGVKGYRCQARFKQSNFLILDFDNGAVSPEIFENIFWHKAARSHRRCFVICNSFSRSSEKPNNFRLFMFYKRPVTSIDEHKLVVSDVEDTLNIHGYSKDKSGLDSCCKSGVQSFYMPCINRNEKDYAFFRKHGFQRMKEAHKYYIDVDSIIRTQTKSKIIPALGNKHVCERSEIENIIRSVQSMTENRNTPFFNAAVQLRSLGLPKADIERYCYEIAGSESKMIQKVPGIMTSLRQYG